MTATHKPMTPGERFMKAISFESVDRIPMMDFGYWRETIENWHKQGLPAEVDSTEEVEAYFGLDRGFETNLVNYWADNGPVGIQWGIWPEFTKVKVGETEDTIIYEGEIGRIVESKAGSIPAHEKSPVETMADFERLVVPRMNAWDPTRVTPEFAGMLERGKAPGRHRHLDRRVLRLAAHPDGADQPALHVLRRSRPAARHTARAHEFYQELDRYGADLYAD